MDRPETSVSTADIEMAAWRDLFGAAPAATRARLGLGFTAIHGTLALRAPGVDSLLFNRVLGLGRRRPVPHAVLDELLAGYARVGVRRFFVHLAADPGDGSTDEIRRWLLAAGLLRFHRSWVELARGAEPLSPLEAPARVRVRPAGLGDARTVASILAAGLDVPDAGRPVFETAVGRVGWHAFLGEIDGRPVSAGLLFERDGLAYLAGGATLAAWRRRGAQSALLRARVERALELGCRRITSETGEAVVGQPNSSCNNMMRLGFRPVGLRDNYARPATRWAAA